MSTMRKGVTSLMTSAVISKVLNFSSNIIITRVIGNQVLGTGSLRLNDLLFLAPQVLAFEGLRRAVYRSTNDKQSLINLSWVAVPVAFIFALFFSTWMFLYPPSEMTHTRQLSYHNSILYTIFAIVIASITEPVFIIAQSELRIKLRANIEIISVFGKCLSMLYLCIYSKQHLEAFAISNLIYTLIACGCYWGYFIGVVGRAPLPKRAVAIDNNMKSTVAVFWRQSLQKWLLENGEKVVLAFMGNATQQGVYVIVERLGSIVVRLVLQPVEEMTITTLGKLRGQRHIFRNWFLLLTFVGLTFACYASAYVHLLLHVLYGNAISNTTSAPFALSWYCVYVLFMAVNGMLEAFVQATASLVDISHYNRWMLLFTLIYMCAVLCLLPLFGAAGLIMANILKMLCRIVVCSLYYTRDMSLPSLLPDVRVLVLCVISFILTQCSALYIYNLNWWRVCIHILVGVVCWATTACVAWRYHSAQFISIDKTD